MAERDLPKYLEAELAIRRRIEQGHFAPGDRIPSEADLAQEMRMSRMTVRHGIGRLVQGGVLQRRAGVGTFVRERLAASAIGVLVFVGERTRPSALLTLELEALQESARAARRTLRVVNVLDPPLRRSGCSRTFLRSGSGRWGSSGSACATRT